MKCRRKKHKRNARDKEDKQALIEINSSKAPGELKLAEAILRLTLNVRLLIRVGDRRVSLAPLGLDGLPQLFGPEESERQCPLLLALPSVTAVAVKTAYVHTTTTSWSRS